MRNLFSIAVLALLAISCGDAGVGFNIGKEFPVEIPVDIPAAELGDVNIPGINPPPVTREEEYSLEGAGYDDLNNLEEVLVKGLAYEISGVESNEQVNLDQLTITLENQFGTTIAEIDITSSQLSNVSKTSIGNAAGLNALKQALDNQEDIVVITTFDFAEIPSSGNIDFDFTLYFDVVAKVRDL